MESPTEMNVINHSQPGVGPAWRIQCAQQVLHEVWRLALAVDVTQQVASSARAARRAEASPLFFGGRRREMEEKNGKNMKKPGSVWAIPNGLVITCNTKNIYVTMCVCV